MTEPAPSFSSSELDRIRVLVAPVAERLAADGHRLYLVGGVVRDLMLADPDISSEQSFSLFHDIDLTTDARPGPIRKALEPSATALWTQGERFGTIGALVDGRELEVTTHRAEAYDPESRKPVVTFGDDLDTDLSRRDFTINAMAIDAADGTLHDPFGGRDDLEQRVLRTPLDPEISFTDDPLRMMRAARFVPRFHLSVDDGLLAAVDRLRDRLAIVSSERVHDELERLLAVPEPRAGLEFLAESGLLGNIVPDLNDRGERAAVEAVTLASVSATPLVRRAGLLWPLGSKRAGSWLSARRYPTADRRLTVLLMNQASVALAALADQEVALAPLLRRAARKLGDERLDDLVDLLAAITSLSDSETIEGAAAGGSVDRIRQVLDELRRSEDLDDLDPPIEGGTIMEALGITSGPDVGRAVAHLVEQRIESGPLSEAEALESVVAWWAEVAGGS